MKSAKNTWSQHFTRSSFLVLMLLASTGLIAMAEDTATSPSAPAVTPAADATTSPAHNAAPSASSPAASVHAPIRAGGVMALDLPNTSAQSISLDILQGRFSDYSAGRLQLTATGIDFRNGVLQALKADVTDGNFDNLLVDKLQIVTPAFSFDTMQLVNNRTFVLAKPVTAKVLVSMSETGVNRFLANPKTLEKIEKSIRKQTGGLKLVTLSNPNFALMGGGRVKVTVMSTVAQGLAIPLEMTGKLAIKEGQLALTGLSMSSGGNNVQMPVDLASSFQSKINEMIDFRRLGKNSLVITADSMKQSGKNITVDGHATLTRLQFG